MKRFVYSPKAYAYIKTDSGTINVSDHIVRGSVNRVVDQVSTAELTLRNPGRKWTNWDTTGPTFRPMDAITIWLKRLPNRPVQVFSGYLDETPYYPLYPGTVTLRASCTLKRLLHTYYDPALPHTQKFLQKYGWVPVPATGQLINDLTVSAQADDGDGQLDATDGSVGRLLFSTLKHLGNWHPNNIWIERLPPELYERVAMLLEAQQTAADEKITPTLQDMLKKIIGVGGHGNGGSSGSTDTSLVTGPAAKQIFCFFTNNGYSEEQAAGFVGNFKAESGFDPGISNLQGSGAYGLAQWLGGRRSNLETFANRHGKPANDFGIQLAFAIHELNGEESGARGHIKAANSVEGATEAVLNYYERPSAQEKADSIANRIAWAKSAYANFAGNCDEEDETGDSSGQEDKEELEKAGTSSVQSRKRARQQVLGTSASSSDKEEDDGTTESEIYTPLKGSPPASNNFGQDRGDHTHAGIDIPVAQNTPCVAPVNGKITLVTPSGFGKCGGMVHFTPDADVGSLKAGQVIGWGHVETIYVKQGDSVEAGKIIALSDGCCTGCHVHFIYRPEGSGGWDGTANPLPIYDALKQGKPPTGGTGGTGGTETTSSGGGDILPSAKASAFAAVFNFPTAAEMTEAIMLTDADGQNKGMMNDQPLLPFVQQLCQGSMRSFQSLPNGNFFGFFPDYFGSFHQRKPYWHVRDIEVLDGNIQLTDDALATHVYVVGDTSAPFAGFGSDDTFFDKLMSQGVITVFNAGAANFLNTNTTVKDPSEDQMRNQDYPLLGSREDVLKFLAKYGARPYLQPEPLIRSHYFEIFAAFQQFQLMWSRQFLTTFTFTFMPELYPGGIVGFPDHGIQMYIDEVQHDFDYENGFTTQANLSAPAALPESNKAWNVGMVRGRGPNLEVGNIVRQVGDDIADSLDSIGP